MGLLEYIFKLDRKFDAFARFIEKKPQDYMSKGEYKQQLHIQLKCTDDKLPKFSNQ